MTYPVKPLLLLVLGYLPACLLLGEVVPWSPKLAIASPAERSDLLAVRSSSSFVHSSFRNAVEEVPGLRA